MFTCQIGLTFSGYDSSCENYSANLTRVVGKLTLVVLRYNLFIDALVTARYEQQTLTFTYQCLLQLNAGNENCEEMGRGG